MADPERRRSRIEKICSLYPAERGRLERAAERVGELANPLTDQAFERALDGILGARTPSEASERIDTMEGVLTSSWLGGIQRTQPVLRKAALVFAGISIVAFSIGVVATLLE